ncbi:MAG TPA: NUDIX hydrolase [Acidimicrobiia bacterium]
MAKNDGAIIRAAGVVVFDPASPPGSTERRFLAVHRPHRSDWSLPKGKVDPGEITPSTAVRECDEETGYRVSLVSRLPTVRYETAGQAKEVDYWIGAVRENEGFAPDDEVDEIRWVPVDEAAEFLTYSDDAELVRLASGAPETTPLVILRHGKAMRRADFDGDDDADRPLSGRGRGEAKRLVDVLEAYGIQKVHSSPFRRCLATVSKYAKSIGVDIAHEDSLSETGHADNPSVTAQRTTELLLQREPTVLCTHRPVLPGVLLALAEHLGIPPAAVHEDPHWDARLPPGGMIVIHREWTDAGPRAFSVEQHHLPR